MFDVIKSFELYVTTRRRTGMHAVSTATGDRIGPECFSTFLVSADLYGNSNAGHTFSELHTSHKSTSGHIGNSEQGAEGMLKE